ncbi:MAG: AAA family ATPase [Halopseudomonas aestusnigri]
MIKAAAIIVTGLPASGKTTVAKELAFGLGWPLLDKDDLLEKLFEEYPVYSFDDRKHLSRLSDDLFREKAENLNNAVLVSHWKPRLGCFDTGTVTEWIPDKFRNIIEVYCACRPQIAMTRFKLRKRHPSHLDSSRAPKDVERQLMSLAELYPLNLGTTLSINTEKPYDIEELLRLIEATSFNLSSSQS